MSCYLKGLTDSAALRRRLFATPDADEVRRFLLDTSLLERFSAPLCEAVTGMDRCDRLLHDLGTVAIVEDGAAAVAWVAGNVAHYGGDPGRITIAGHSAGAHIAALLALDRRYLDAEGVRR